MPKKIDFVTVDHESGTVPQVAPKKIPTLKEIIIIILATAAVYLILNLVSFLISGFFSPNLIELSKINYTKLSSGAELNVFEIEQDKAKGYIVATVCLELKDKNDIDIWATKDLITIKNDMEETANLIFKGIVDKRGSCDSSIVLISSDAFYPYVYNASEHALYYPDNRDKIKKLYARFGKMDMNEIVKDPDAKDYLLNNNFAHYENGKLVDNFTYYLGGAEIYDGKFSQDLTGFIKYNG